MEHAVAELAALAAGLCQDAGIRVELSERTWAWDPMHRTILVSAEDLKSKGPIYCAAVLAHEVSHFYISRYHLFSPPFPSAAARAHALNSIEDPRVNTWIKRRYPGTGRWLRALTQADANSPLPGAIPDFLLFCLECAREELRGWKPAAEGVVSPAIADALAKTRDARRRYAETLPAGDLTPELNDVELFYCYLDDVWPHIVNRARRDLPTRREQWIRILTQEALDIAEREILPVAAEFLEKDLGRISSLLKGDANREKDAEDAVARDDVEALRRLMGESLDKDPDANPSPGLRELAIKVFEAWLRSTQESASGRAGGRPLIETDGARTMRGRPSRLPASLRRKGLVRLPPAQTLYERAYAKIADQLQQLVASIESLLRPRRRLRESSGHPTGHRLDMKRVIAYDADPRLWDKIWRRKNVPDRHRTIIHLLVDLSGSMRGAKTDAAVAGTVLLAEALHRLEVPFAIDGFQDILIPFCDFHEGLTARVRDGIGEMTHEVEGCRSAGNNCPSYNDDGPCLRDAAQKLLKEPADDRLLIVISDGLPEGRRSTERDLVQAIDELSKERGLKLVGIGLGPDTSHVTKFYPHSKANVGTDQLAAEIADVLRAAVLHSR
jgi:hypothetical protein